MKQKVFALKRTHYPQGKGQVITADYKHKAGKWYTEIAKHICFFPTIHHARLEYEAAIKRNPCWLEPSKAKLEIVEIEIKELGVVE